MASTFLEALALTLQTWLQRLVNVGPTGYWEYSNGWRIHKQCLWLRGGKGSYFRYKAAGSDLSAVGNGNKTDYSKGKEPASS